MLMSLTTFQAFTPVAILLISWVSRLQEPNRKLAVIVCMISTGVALASQGELHFNLLGFLTQSAAVAVSPLSTFAAIFRRPPRGWLACSSARIHTRPQRYIHYARRRRRLSQCLSATQFTPLIAYPIHSLKPRAW